MIAQLLVNSILSACIYLLIAVGFTVIYRAVRFFHFAHAVVYTSGPYFAYLFYKILGIPVWSAIPLAVALSAFVGCLIETLIYKPLRKRGVTSLVLLLASLGLYILLQNAISMFFGDDTKSIRSGVVREGLPLFGARITPIQIAIILSGLLITALTAVWLRKSATGRSIRAVADDAELSRISGIDSDRVILWCSA
jgi:branched-chain amino acid transport system permease protein